MFKHILIPPDGSDLSRKALLYAIQLAKESNAKVTALTVRPPYVDTNGYTETCKADNSGWDATTITQCVAPNNYCSYASYYIDLSTDPNATQPNPAFCNNTATLDETSTLAAYPDLATTGFTSKTSANASAAPSL